MVVRKSTISKNAECAILKGYIEADFSDEQIMNKFNISLEDLENKKKIIKG